MSEETLRQTIIDEEHLKLLSLGYMVSAGVAAFFSMFGLMYVVIGVVMSISFSHTPETASRTAEAPPAFLGLIFAGIGLALFLFMVAVAALKFRAGLCIKKHQSRTFCMVIAALSCLEFPYGTVLGVLTFIVLGRDSVTRMFTSKTSA
jgi:hypothetical protein